jgi:hypothetical protein
VPDDDYSMISATRYAKNGDVLIACQMTGDAPIPVILAPGTVPHRDFDWEFSAEARLVSSG